MLKQFTVFVMAAAAAAVLAGGLFAASWGAKDASVAVGLVVASGVFASVFGACVLVALWSLFFVCVEGAVFRAFMRARRERTAA